jgi:hypothetical protein
VSPFIDEHRRSEGRGAGIPCTPSKDLKKLGHKNGITVTTKIG